MKLGHYSVNPLRHKRMVVARELLDFPNIIKKRNIPNILLYKNSSTPNSFQDAMKIPLIIMQIFGFFPVHGITKPNCRSLKFNWKSWKVVYSLLCICGYTLDFILYCYHKKVDTVLTLNAIFFHLEGVILSILFLYAAIQWPRFVKEWHLVEISMKSYSFSFNLKRKINLILLCVLGLALVEHLMVLIHDMLNSIKKHPQSVHESIQDYFVHKVDELFSYVPYSIWTGLVFQVFVFQKTFIWTFVDVFIIVISICFHYRLQQISKKLIFMAKAEVLDENLWRVIREDYVKLCKLCALINNQLCWFIITSFFTNLYHILTQLFSSLRPIEDTFHKIYFYVSFFLLILRVIIVSIFGGAVYDEYEQITRILTSVPSACYNIEVERFVTHLATNETALTGKGFFKITRNLILKVMSAIVTYELVLIQFNQQEFKTKDS